MSKLNGDKARKNARDRYKAKLRLRRRQLRDALAAADREKASAQHNLTLVKN